MEGKREEGTDESKEGGRAEEEIKVTLYLLEPFH